jgi:sRNA-binding protein
MISWVTWVAILLAIYGVSELSLKGDELSADATGVIGENSPAGTFDNDFSVRVLSQAKQENATDRKATRAEQRQAQSSSPVSKANADTQEQAKVATVQESNEKQKITREEVLDVGAHKLGEFLYMIDKEKQWE